MKFKISWPTGIIISLASFIIFILYFVYKVTFVPAYDHHLVSEDYYKDEINYQQEIDKLNSAAELKQNITYRKVDGGLLISFPEEFKASDIKGSIDFQRGSNTKIDFNIPIDLETLDFLITNDKLVEGRWDIRIDWIANGKAYLFKEKIMY
ncbi:MAG: cytochrome C oxidase Cbb3 [Lutibacter sp.]|uniref:FixH family protein n=1 Tax=Lutibacter sp. TaxID=1925666 RepID=UPI0018281C16|nr:FixH family protein [Lutibacter sp.]MBT8317816.1 FixH family protein [Lutibacter sp.]NNJ58674.1 cytochrome C oxidase Cbb3 [Lutibacter sp.]